MARNNNAYGTRGVVTGTLSNIFGREEADPVTGMKNSDRTTSAPSTTVPTSSVGTVMGAARNNANVGSQLNSIITGRKKGGKVGCATGGKIGSSAYSKGGKVGLRKAVGGC